MKYIRFIGLALSWFAVSSLTSASEEGSDAVSPSEVIARALQHNFDIQVQRLDVDISRDRIQGARGEFDPVFSVNLGYDRTQRAQNARDLITTQEEIFDEESYSTTAGLSGLLPTGTRYEVTTGAVRRQSSFTSRPTARFDPEYQSTSQLTLIQPLLRNAGTDVNLAQIRVLKSESLSAKYEARVGVESVMGRVLAACFDLEFAVENIRVKEESLELAQSLLAENTRRVEEGRMSPIDVTQAQVRVSEAREELIEAHDFHAERQNLLRELTGADYDFNAPYVVVRGVGDVLPEMELQREALVGEMFSKSPLYQSAMETVEGERLRLMFAENQRYPQIDLQLSLGYNGLRDSAGRAYYDYSRRNRPDWGVGLEVSFPIGNRTARARVSEADRRRRQALLKVKQTEVQLLAALDNAVREVESGIERRELIEDSVRLAEEALTSEERRLDAGRTTSYNVLTQQRELSFVQTRALAADAEVRRSMTQLLLIQGSLADSLGFAINVE